MATYSDLPRDQKLLVNRLYGAVVEAQNPGVASGHLPNCGIDLEKRVICDCAATGDRIMQALVDVVYVEVRALDPEYQQYLKLQEKFGGPQRGEPINYGPVRTTG